MSSEWSEERPATQEEQNICDIVRHQIPEDFKLYKAFAYRRLDLAGGGKHDIKVYVGDDKGVRLTIGHAFISTGPTDYKVERTEHFTIGYVNI
ncbi:hypothetical protein MHYP_G00346920 [Metynnis hypsauchen]